MMDDMDGDEEPRPREVGGLDASDEEVLPGRASTVATFTPKGGEDCGTGSETRPAPETRPPEYPPCLLRRPPTAFNARRRYKRLVGPPIASP
jgi:hypothetical protein